MLKEPKKQTRAKKRILVVDDEKDICEMLALYLRRKSFVIDIAHNGKEAIDFLTKEKPDLIILDVIMPIMDGFELLQSLKKDSAYSLIPVIMLTIKSEPHNVEKGILLQADFYLPKPCKLDNLMDFINIIVKE